jgi:WD40-like Beta Propeller Repeat
MLLGLMFVATIGGAPTLDATKLTLSRPAAIVEIDTKKLEGDLYRLSWSPDGQRMYLQTVERDRTGNIRATHHYLLTLDGQGPAKTGQEPDWSTAYWAWKSTPAAPGLPGFRIDAEESQKRVSGTATPMGGDLAKGGLEGSGSGPVGAGATAGAMDAAMQSQVAHYWTLKLKGEVVGEFVNAAAIPGLTFGWAPANTGLIAFANRDGRIVIMDDQGRKQEIASSRSALLPGWTDDGKRLAFLERVGKNKVSLKVVEVTTPTAK